MIVVTFKEIRDKAFQTRPLSGACPTELILKHLGAESLKDNDFVKVSTILDACGVYNALHVLQRCFSDGQVTQMFATDCAERVLHLFEAECPNDSRPRDAIGAGKSLYPSLEVQSYYAKLALEAAESVAGIAAKKAASSAAFSAYARGSHGSHMSHKYAVDAVTFMHGKASFDLGKKEEATQKARLRQYLEHGDYAKHMAWPL